MIGNAAILDTAIARLTGLEAAIESFIAELMQQPDFTDWLIYFNRAQMQEGKRPDDTDITKTPKGHQVSDKYEPLTKWIKDKQGKQYSKVTLRDTGDFYINEKVKIADQAITFYDTDPKTDELLATWGSVLGISNENLEKFITIIKPDFYTFANNYFYGNK